MLGAMADEVAGAPAPARTESSRAPSLAVVEGPILVVVRRGAAERFIQLQESFRGTATRVIWDRRRAERRRPPRRSRVNRRRAPEEPPIPEGIERRASPRRSGADRRLVVRRSPAPETWTALDFVLVHRGAGSPTASPGDD
jgi:hypothetical protein